MPITILDSDTDTDTAQSHSPSPDGTHDSRDSESIPFYENQLADPLYNGQYALEKELKEFGALRDNQEMLHKSPICHHDSHNRNTKSAIPHKRSCPTDSDGDKSDKENHHSSSGYQKVKRRRKYDYAVSLLEDAFSISEKAATMSQEAVSLSKNAINLSKDAIGMLADDAESDQSQHA